MCNDRESIEMTDDGVRTNGTDISRVKMKSIMTDKQLSMQHIISSDKLRPE